MPTVCLIRMRIKVGVSAFERYAGAFAHRVLFAPRYPCLHLGGQKTLDNAKGVRTVLLFLLISLAQIHAQTFEQLRGQGMDAAIDVWKEAGIEKWVVGGDNMDCEQVCSNTQLSCSNSIDSRVFDAAKSAEIKALVQLHGESYGDSFRCNPTQYYTSNERAPFINQGDCYHTREVSGTPHVFTCLGSFSGQRRICPCVTTNSGCGVGHTFSAEFGCVPCAADTFKSTQGNQACTLCPQNTTSFPGSSQPSQCRCVSGTTGPHSGPCTPCAADTFNEVTSLTISGTQCQSVIHGAFVLMAQSYNGRPAYVAQNGTLFIYYYSPWRIFAISGILGSDGIYARVETFASSIPSNGWREMCNYSFVNSDLVVQVHDSECRECPEGTTSTEQSFGRFACVCNAGLRGSGPDNCKKCHEGTYKTNIGNLKGACTNCPLNHHSPEGSTSDTDCVCSAGYTYSAEFGCLACASGTFKAAPGSSACVAYECPADQFSSEAAANTAPVCWACPSRTLSIQASTAATACQCQAGTYEETHVLNPQYMSRQYSSVRTNHSMSRLDDLHLHQAWVAGEQSAGESMYIDAGEPMHIVGVITQGRDGINITEWVTEFTMTYTLDVLGGSVGTVPGTFSSTSALKIEHLFSAPIYARYLLITVQDWNSTISMRAALVVKSCSSCLASATSVQGSESASACVCPAGTSKFSSSADQRALALVPGRAQLSTLGNRGLRAYAATAEFNSSAGPENSKGAVTFDRATSQYLDGGSHQFDVRTNGFTAVTVAKFVGSASRFERIFNFGGAAHHIALHRQSWSNALGIQMTGEGYDCRIYSSLHAIIQDQWLTILVQYTSSNNTLKLQVGNDTHSVHCITPPTDFIANYTYIGKSVFNQDEYSSVSIAGLYAVDALLTDQEIATLISRMNAGEDTLQACTVCPAGTYKKNTWDALCTPCPSFSHHALTNQTSVDACVCQIGFVWNATAQGCNRCPLGTFNNMAGDTQCFACHSPSNFRVPGCSFINHASGKQIILHSSGTHQPNALGYYFNFVDVRTPGTAKNWLRLDLLSSVKFNVIIIAFEEYSWAKPGTPRKIFASDQILTDPSEENAILIAEITDAVRNSAPKTANGHDNNVFDSLEPNFVNNPTGRFNVLTLRIPPTSARYVYLVVYNFYIHLNRVSVVWDACNTVSCRPSPIVGTGCPGLCVAPAGFQTTPSGENLMPCHANTYNNGSFLTCQQCPTGSSTTAVGSMRETVCACHAGYFRRTAGNGACEKCDMGTYKSTLGDASCEKCALNSTSRSGSTVADACVCVEGFTLQTSTGLCTPCGENTYKARDFRDLVLLEKPYIVSTARDWNGTSGRFDSLCGVEACTGSTGVSDKSALTVLALLPRNQEASVFASESTRNIYLGSASRPSYNATGGPTGNGHISFNKSSAHFLDRGASTFNINTNGGFTIVVVFKFTGQMTPWQRIIDFGDGPDQKNIILGTISNSKMMEVSIYNMQDTQVCSMKPPNVFEVETWYDVTAKYNKNGKVVEFFVNGVLSSTLNCTFAVVDRTVSNTYIGKDNWGGGSSNMDIAGLLVVDAYLQEDAVAAIVASIYAGEDLLRARHPRVVSTGVVVGHGAAVPVDFVGGDTNVKMQWGAGSIPVAFTICSVTRYSGSIQQRILNCRGNPYGESLNWLHGHWTQKAGSTFYNGSGNVNYAITPNTDWVVVCGRNANAGDGTIVNAITTSVANGGIGNCPLGINYDASSDWQLSKLYIWDYHLSDSDFALASSSLYAALSAGSTDGLCLACPANSQSTAGAAACVCNVGYTGPPESCTVCPAGTYKSNTGDALCTLCPAGRYSAAVGALNSEVCLNCPVGRYSAAEGASNLEQCLDCPQDTFLPEEGGSSSSACQTCGAGNVSLPGSPLCVPCPDGHYKSDESLVCIVCPDGLYRPEDSLVCVPCLQQHFCTGGLATACNANSFMTPPDLTDAFSPDECRCNAGFSHLTEDERNTNVTVYDNECHACTPGFYNEEYHQMHCSPCGPGFFSNVSASLSALDCALCPVNTFSDAGEEACNRCPVNTSAPAGSGAYTNCTCDAGYAGPDGGTCELCGVGTYKNVIGSSLCVACPANHFSPPGSISDTDCVCDVGYTYSAESACVPCAPDSFKNTPGSHACTPCQRFSHSLAGASSAEQCVCDAGLLWNTSAPPVPGPNPEFVLDTGNFGTLRVEISRGFPVVMRWPSAAHPVGITTDSSGSPSLPDFVILADTPNEQTTFTVPENFTGSLYYFCENHAGMGVHPVLFVNADLHPGAACLCDAGNYTVAPGVCAECPVGSFQDVPGAPACKECPADTYGTAVGAAACTACPAFSNHANTNQTRVEACVCQAGYLWNAMGQVCDQCPAKTFNNGPQDGRCFECNSYFANDLLIHYQFESIPVNGGRLLNYGNLGSMYDADITLQSNGIERRMDMHGRFSYYWIQNTVNSNYLSIPNNFAKLLAGREHSFAFWTLDNNVQDKDSSVHCGPPESQMNPQIKIHTPWNDAKVYYMLGNSWYAKPASMSNSQKTHWVFTRENRANGIFRMSVYKNGALFGFGDNSNVDSFNSAYHTVFVGFNHNNAFNEFRFNDKTMEDFRIYGKRLQASEVTTLYETIFTVGKSCPGLSVVPAGYQVSASGANPEPCPVNTYNKGSDPSSVYAVEEARAALSTGVSGWRLVRFVPIGAERHSQSLDWLQGTEVYGNGAPTPAATNGSWSVLFGDFDQYYISNGAATGWVYFNRNQLTKEIPVTSNSFKQITYLKSSISQTARTERQIMHIWGEVYLSVGPWSSHGIVYMGGGNGMSPGDGTLVFVRNSTAHVRGFSPPPTCQSCPMPSTYVARGGLTSVAECECAAGYSRHANGVCTACAVGSYQPATGDAPCLVCPANTTTLQPASPTFAECVCDVDFERVDGVCQACTRPAYKLYPGNEACIVCGPDAALNPNNTRNNQTSCECQGGFVGDWQACSACPVGSYKPLRGAQLCEQCPLDTYNDVTGVLACTACPDFSISFPGSTSVADCVCILGYTYSAESGCVPCASDTFKNLRGNQACTPCQRFSKSPEGASNVKQCVCDAGYFWNISTPTAPGPNPAFVLDTENFGTLRVKISRGFPVVMRWPSAAHPVGITTDSSGSPSLPEFEILTDAQNEQTNFTVPEDFTGSLYYFCENHAGMGVHPVLFVDTDSHPGAVCLCDAGNYTVSPEVCEMCPVGSFQNVPGASTCKVCLANTYSPEIGAAACTACPAFSNHTKMNQTRVEVCVCNIGYVWNHTTQLCDACPANTFNNRAGEGKCFACCPSGDSDGVSCNEFENIPAGYQETVPRGNLESCPVNTYHNGSKFVCPPVNPYAKAEAAAALRSGVSGWRLVRFLPSGLNAVHQARDYLVGTDVYGKDAAIPSSTSAPGSWSVLFGKFDQFFLANGAMSDWAYFNRNMIFPPRLCAPCAFSYLKSSRSSGPTSGNFIMHVNHPQTTTRAVMFAAGNWDSGIVYIDDSFVYKPGAGSQVFVRDSTAPALLPKPTPPCQTCPFPSTYTPRGNLTSVAECECAAGYYRVGGVCVSCAPGSYKALPGPGSCDLCAANEVTAIGPTSLSDCQCRPGTTGPGNGGECVVCPANTYKNLPGNGSCTPCQNRSTSLPDSKAFTDCMCNAGQGTLQYRDTSRASKVLCRHPAGFICVGPENKPAFTHNYFYQSPLPQNDEETFTTEFGSFQQIQTVWWMDPTHPICKKCVAVTHFPAAMNPVPGGHIFPNMLSFNNIVYGAEEYPFVQRFCNTCPANTYSLPGGSCLACPANSVSLPGAAMCLCNAGWTGIDAQYPNTCMACPRDTYKTVVGPGVCLDCLANSYSMSASPAITDCKCHPEWNLPGGSVCPELCPGNFSAPKGSNQSTDCVCKEGAGGQLEKGIFLDFMVNQNSNPSIQLDAWIKYAQNNGMTTNVNSATHGLYIAWTYNFFLAYPLPPQYNTFHVTIKNFCHGGQFCQRRGGIDLMIDGVIHMTLPTNLDKFFTFKTFYRPGQVFRVDTSKNGGISPDLKIRVFNSVCAGCVAGTFSPSTGNEACLACVPGKYSAETESIADPCQVCPAGLSTPAGQSGAVKCSLCAPGSDDPPNGVAACVLCPTATYKSEIGPMACTPCPSNSSAAAVGTLNQTSCRCNGGYGGDASGSATASECAACPVHTFKPGGVNSNCSACGPSYISPPVSVSAAACVCKAGSTETTIFDVILGPHCEDVHGTYKDTGAQSFGNSIYMRTEEPRRWLFKHGGEWFVRKSPPDGIYPGDVYVYKYMCGSHVTAIRLCGNIASNCAGSITWGRGTTATSVAAGPFCKCNPGHAPDVLEDEKARYREFEARAETRSGVLGWRLTRFLGPSARWHQATDNLRGTDVYGLNSSTPAIEPGSWSVPFGNFDEFFISNPQGSHWAYFPKSSAIGSNVNGFGPRTIWKSSLHPLGPTYTATWHTMATDAKYPTIQVHNYNQQAPYLYSAGRIGENAPLSGNMVLVRMSSDTNAPYVLKTSPNSCSVCPANTYSVAGAACVACPTNSTSSPGATICMCDAGWTGINTVHPDSCVVCPANTYKSGAGPHVCLKCPGTSNSSSASTAITDCKCRAGTTGADAVGACVTCPANTYKNLPGNGSCISCQNRSTSPPESTAFTDCMCNAGQRTNQYRDTSRASRVLCRLDTRFICVGPENKPAFTHNYFYQSPLSQTGEESFTTAFGSFQQIQTVWWMDPGNPICQKCVAVTHFPAAMNPVPGGHIFPNMLSFNNIVYGAEEYPIVQHVCSRCPANTYSLPGGLCLACPANSASSPGAALCLCNTGWIGIDAQYPNTCVACPQDTYKSVVGPGVCLDCPAISNSMSASDAITDCKCHPEWNLPGGSVCPELCPGNFSAPKGSNQSIDCACKEGAGGQLQKGILLDFMVSQNPALYPDIWWRLEAWIKYARDNGMTTDINTQTHGLYIGHAHHAFLAYPLPPQYNTLLVVIQNICHGGQWCHKRGSIDLMIDGVAQMTIPNSGNFVTFKTFYRPGQIFRVDMAKGGGISPPLKISVFNSVCAGCVAGTFSPSTGNAACIACVPGKYSAETESIADPCQVCPAGLSTPAGQSGAVECSLCAPGSDDPPNGVAACVLCPAATYKSELGPMACTQCPYDSSTAAVGTLNQTGCLCSGGHSGDATQPPNTQVATFSTRAGPPAGSDKYSEGVLAPNGNIYMVPATASHFGKISGATKQFSTVQHGGANGYWGGVLAGNGKIYCVPSRIFSNVGVFDTSIESFATIPITGAVEYAYIQGVLGSDGRVYFAPGNANNIGVVDPATNVFSTVSITGVIPHFWSFFGGVRAANNLIYFTPMQAASIGVLDTSKSPPAFSLISIPATAGGRGGAWGQYRGATLARNGNIYYAPTGIDNIGVVAVATGVFSVIPIPAVSTGANRFRGNVLGPDGKVYFIPYNEDSIGVLDVQTSVYSSIAIPAIGAGKFSGGVFGRDGVLYMSPVHVDVLGVLQNFTQPRCAACAANTFKPGGVNSNCSACGPSYISPPVSASAAACVCKAGSTETTIFDVILGPHCEDVHGTYKDTGAQSFGNSIYMRTEEPRRWLFKHGGEWFVRKSPPDGIYPGDVYVYKYMCGSHVTAIRLCGNIASNCAGSITWGRGTTATSVAAGPFCNCNAGQTPDVIDDESSRYREFEAHAETLSGVLGWKLKRFLGPSAQWHQATDNLRGTDVYGLDSSTPAIAPGSWSVLFGNFDEFFISNLQGSHWAYFPKSSAIGSNVNGFGPRTIWKSSLHPLGPTYTATWHTMTSDGKFPIIQVHNYNQQAPYLYAAARVGENAPLSGNMVLVRMSSDINAPYVPRMSLNSCSACAADTYKITPGSHECTACAAHANSPPGSTLKTQCLCDASSSGVSGGPCSVCLPGFYKNITLNQTHCSPCAMNTFKSTAGAGVCSACPSGLYAVGGNPVCLVCEIGDDHCPWGSGMNTHTSGKQCTDTCDTQARCVFAVYQRQQKQCYTWTALGMQRAKPVANSLVATTYKRCFPTIPESKACAACPQDMGSDYANRLTGMHGWTQIKHLPAGSDTWFFGQTFNGLSASGTVQTGSPTDSTREWAVPFNAAAARYFLFVCKDSEYVASAPDVWAVTENHQGSNYNIWYTERMMNGNFANSYSSYEVCEKKCNTEGIKCGWFSYNFLNGQCGTDWSGTPLQAMYYRNMHMSGANIYYKTDLRKIYKAAGHPLGLSEHRPLNSPQIPATKIRNGRLFKETGQFSPLPFRAYHLLYAEGGSTVAAGPPAATCAVYVKYSEDVKVGPECIDRFSRTVGPGAMVVRITPVNRALVLDSAQISARFTHTIAPDFANAEAAQSIRFSPETLFFTAEPASYVRMPHFNPSFLTKSRFLAMHSESRDVLSGTDAFSAGTIFRNKETGAFTALSLKVVPGYMGPGGPGFVQELNFGDLREGVVVDVRLVLGATTAVSRIHMLMFVSETQMSTAALSSDWQWIVCAQKNMDALQMCKQQPDPDGGTPNNKNPKVLDGVVVPLSAQSGCCGTLRLSLPVSGLDTAQPTAGRVALVSKVQADRSLWRERGGLNEFVPLCVPASVVFSRDYPANNYTDVAGGYPCRWPSGVESPFPGETPSGAVGPWWFDKVFLVDRGWMLVCIELHNSTTYRIAETQRAGPRHADWNFNIPAKPYIFEIGSNISIPASVPAGCASVQTCPDTGYFTSKPGLISWTPTNAASARWLYTVFIAGPTGACVKYNCDEGLAYQNTDITRVNSAESVSLFLFRGTRLVLRGGLMFKPLAGARRLLGVTQSFQRLRQRQSHAVYRLPPVLAQHYKTRRPIPPKMYAAVAVGRPGRALLNVAGQQQAPAAPRETIATREILGLHNNDQVANAVCLTRAGAGSVCRMLDVKMSLSDKDYCMEEGALVAKAQLALEPLMQAAGQGTVRGAYVTSVNRPLYQQFCKMKHSQGRRLLQTRMSVSLNVVVSGTSDMRIEIDGAALESFNVTSIISQNSTAQTKSLHVQIRQCDGGAGCNGGSVTPIPPKTALALQDHGVPSAITHSVVTVRDPRPVSTPWSTGYLVGFFFVAAVVLLLSYWLAYYPSTGWWWRVNTQKPHQPEYIRVADAPHRNNVLY